MALSEAERSRLRERLRFDTPLWARHCATVLNEDRQPVKLVARPWQARTPETPAHITPLDEALERQRAADMPMRLIVLKARKLGCSTWVQAKFMQRVTQLEHQYALVIAHQRQAASVLADMARLMYDRLPREEELGFGFSIRPQLIAANDARASNRHMVLGDKMQASNASRYETGTAGAKGGGRAATPSMVHCSEAAHWEDPEYIVGLLNAVPKRPETIVVIESTANGFNSFHDRWQRAVEGAEDPETGGTYAHVFYGWHDNPYNRMEFVSDLARSRFERTVGDPDAGDPDEISLIEDGLTLEQLYWRRTTISEECDGKLENFHQEHPYTPEEAFIGSGTPFFGGVLISKAMKQAVDSHEPVEGVLRGLDWSERVTKAGTVRVPGKAIWVPEMEMTRDDLNIWGSTHRLRVWEHPTNAATQEGVAPEEMQVDSQHVVFADVAQGKGNTIEERDYSAIQVINHVTQEQVASYHSRIPLHEYPLICYLVALYYNRAWLAPEVTGLGIGVLDTLHQDMQYPLLYRRRRGGDDERDDRREHVLGWYTDGRSKPLMEVTFGSSLKDGTHGLRCVRTVRQMTTYVTDERGGRGAQKGSHDDLLMAYMGAKRVGFELMPRDYSKKKTGRVRGYPG